MLSTWRRPEKFRKEALPERFAFIIPPSIISAAFGGAWFASGDSSGRIFPDVLITAAASLRTTAFRRRPDGLGSPSYLMFLPAAIDRRPVSIGQGK